MIVINIERKLKLSSDSKEQLIDDYKLQIEELVKENTVLSDKKKKLEHNQQILNNKLVSLFTKL